MKAVDTAEIECRARDGAKVATVVLTLDMNNEERVELAPLVSITAEAAVEHGETEYQLRENGRYDYDVKCNGDTRDLRLRSHLARRRPVTSAQRPEMRAA